MDPVTLVLTALAAGASAGLTGTATQGISDAYAGLKELLRRRFAGRDPGALDAEETEPEAWRARLGGQLAVDDVDDEVRVAAERLLATADPAGSQGGKYTVDLREAKGVQVGDNNTQTNTFS